MTDNYPVHFKFISEGRSAYFKIPELRDNFNRVEKTIPKYLLISNFVQTSGSSVEIAFMQQREWRPAEATIITYPDNSLPQFAAYDAYGRPTPVRVKDYIYIEELALEKGITYADFIKGMNYLYEIFVERNLANVKCHIAYFGKDNTLIRMCDKLPVPHESPKKKDVKDVQSVK